MNESRKIFTPFVLLCSVVFLLALLFSLYTRMYYGEYTTRSLSLEIYRYALGQDEPTEWMTQYREEKLAIVEENPGVAFDGMFDNLGNEMLVFNRYISTFSRIDRLQDAWQRETMKAERAAKRGIKAEDAEGIANAFLQIEPPEYGNYQPFEDMIEWNRSYGWLILVLFCGICLRAYTMEYTTGVHLLIYSMAVRPGRIACRKVMSVMLFVFGMLTLFYIAGSGLTVYMAGSVRELGQPVQAFLCMETSRLPLKIWQLILYQYTASLCMSLFVCGFVLLVSAFTRSVKNTAVITCAVLLLPQILFRMIPSARVFDTGIYLGATELLQGSSPLFGCISAVLAVIGTILLTGSAMRFRRR